MLVLKTREVYYLYKLRLARLNSDARDSTLTIDSDIIKLEESILNITGNNSFVMRNDNDKPTVIDSEYIKNIELSFDNTNVTIDAQTVNFDWWKTPSSNTEHAPSLNFHGENSFVAKNIVVFESNNRFVNSKVISHKTLSFKGMSNAIMDSEISFSEKNQNYSEIKDFISRDSTLSDVSGTLTGSINSVKGEEITIKEGGQFNILPANAQETGVDTYLSSITIEEGSELLIGANGVDKKTISLSNVKVSNGNNIVVFSQDTNINNTQLSGVELSIEKNESGKFEVSNSTLANKIVLKNVSSVNLSKIKYLDCNSSYFYLKTNGFMIAVECDIFKFIKATLSAGGKAKPSGTICLFKNKYKEKGELNSTSEENIKRYIENQKYITFIL